MVEDKISWCKKQRSGIELVDKNNILSISYMKEADETLENMLKISGKWKVITAYYSCYNALYSILIRCGIKSEIHSCTIELMSLFDFSDGDIELMKNLKDMRTNAQYYLKEEKLSDVDKIKRFVLKCKVTVEQLSEEKIVKVREIIEEK